MVDQVINCDKHHKKQSHKSGEMDHYVRWCDMLCNANLRKSWNPWIPAQRACHPLKERYMTYIINIVTSKRCLDVLYFATVGVTTSHKKRTITNFFCNLTFKRSHQQEVSYDNVELAKNLEIFNPLCVVQVHKTRNPVSRKVWKWFYLLSTFIKLCLGVKGLDYACTGNQMTAEGIWMVSTIKIEVIERKEVGVA